MPLQYPVETFERKSLFAANQIMPVVNGKITVANGEGKLTAGALLTSAGKLCAKTTGGEPEKTTVDEVYAVLAQDVDATSAAVEAACFYTGEFREEALSFKTDNSATIADFVVSARKVGIFIRPSL